MHDLERLAEMLSHLSSAAHWSCKDPPDALRVARRFQLAERAARRISSQHTRGAALAILKVLYELAGTPPEPVSRSVSLLNGAK